MARHLGKPDLQLLSLAEIFEEACNNKVPPDTYPWQQCVADPACEVGEWTGMWLSLFHPDTVQATSEWIKGMPDADIG
eukprot:CAMPEP_0173414094 /NCGR_PEP_ID=MMETSP1356-20130122/83639_1 /TAXON_ID=77927 ORGANISM="Hemiselmis virescens, Strain PCC157" /NCGR_SAMPLE_ID=MMETSP1356 /ASSEMBLY_ACC=CAM_ASM_000847 /LENGTH=77 /DNA_ID=CAMNT_0014376213 /DNA_START=27 /DNA_END=256 /DNA_ORIENTATION=+